MKYIYIYNCRIGKLTNIISVVFIYKPHFYDYKLSKIICR